MKVLVEFEFPQDAARAIRVLTSLGYLDVDTYTPFPVTSEEGHAPRGSLPLGLLAFGGGVAAMVAAYLVQWWANAWSYPVNAGGRPAHAAPAFVPATFETICLAATIAVFAGFLVLERLPRLWQAAFDIDGFERATVDRFWLGLDVADDGAALDRVTADVLPLHPLRIVAGEGDS